MKCKREEKEHDGEQRGGKLRIAVPREAESSGEEGDADEDDPEGMKGQPSGYAGRKGPYVEEMLGSEGGERRRGEDPAEDDDLVETGGSGEFFAHGDEAHDEEDDPGQPQPEDVVCKQSCLFLARHTSAEAGSRPESSDLTFGIA